MTRIIRNKKTLETFRAKTVGDVGYVATMGALHKGHMGLIARAKAENDTVVVSIFVNVVQFSEGEDYDNYPRDEKNDIDLLKQAGVDVVFIPTVENMYPSDRELLIRYPSLSSLYCGKTRPNFFDGVLKVILKFFHLIEPTRAYFGKKDYQQFFLIKKMVEDLDLPIEVIPVPTERAENGLALSSRNQYLKKNEIDLAGGFYAELKDLANTLRQEQLEDAKRSILKKKNPRNKRNNGSLVSNGSLKTNALPKALQADKWQPIVAKKIKQIKKHKHFKLDYVVLVNKKTLLPVETYKKGSTVILGAVFMKLSQAPHVVRLIDNIEC